MKDDPIDILNRVSDRIMQHTDSGRVPDALRMMSWSQQIDRAIRLLSELDTMSVATEDPSHAAELEAADWAVHEIKARSC